MADEANFQSGDITKFQITVKADGTEYDVSYHVVMLEVYQSLFTPSVVCRMELNDRTNVLAKAGLTGREEWTLTFQNNITLQPTVLTMHPLKIEDISPRPDLQGQQYLIICSSKEAFVDLATYVQKSYKTTISSIVEDVYRGFLQTKKPLNIECTAGIPSLIIPNLTAFQTLAFLRARAVSASRPASAFVSFESLEGFHFVNLESLIDNEAEYSYKLQNSSVLEADPLSKQDTLIGYKQSRKFDIQDLLIAGGVGSVTSEYNIRTKSFTETNISPSEKSLNWAKLNPNRANANIGINFQGVKPSYLTFYDPDRNEPQVSLHRGERLAFLSDLMQNQLEVDIPGNVDIFPGSVIYLDIGDFSVSPESRPKGAQSGKYLVADVLHTIDRGVRLSSKLTLFKESLLQNV